MSLAMQPCIADYLAQHNPKFWSQLKSAGWGNQLKYPVPTGTNMGVPSNPGAKWAVFAPSNDTLGNSTLSPAELQKYVVPNPTTSLFTSQTAPVAMTTAANTRVVATGNGQDVVLDDGTKIKSASSLSNGTVYQVDSLLGQQTPVKVTPAMPTNPLTGAASTLGQTLANGASTVPAAANTLGHTVANGIANGASNIAAAIGIPATAGTAAALSNFNNGKTGKSGSWTWLIWLIVIILIILLLLWLWKPEMVKSYMILPTTSSW